MPVHVHYDRSVRDRLLGKWTVLYCFLRPLSFFTPSKHRPHGASLLYVGLFRQLVPCSTFCVTWVNYQVKIRYFIRENIEKEKKKGKKWRTRSDHIHWANKKRGRAEGLGQKKRKGEDGVILLFLLFHPMNKDCWARVERKYYKN